MTKQSKKPQSNALKSEKYWSQRGKSLYKYRGEKFYTVTPIPYYYKRRKLLLDLVYDYFDKKSINNILDFGCGDGWYINHFKKQFKNKFFYGCDISPVMVNEAKLLKAGKIEVSKNGIPFNIQFDMIYCFAVWAHIMDKSVLEKSCRQIYDKLIPGARFLLFEQTGKKEKSGENWSKRTENFYLEMAKRNGFILEKKHFISFPLFRLYEKFLMPRIYKLFLSGSNYTEKCINANKSSYLKKQHEILIKLASLPIFKNIKFSEGNTLFVFKKKC